MRNLVAHFVFILQEDNVVRGNNVNIIIGFLLSMSAYKLTIQGIFLVDQDLQLKEMI